MKMFQPPFFRSTFGYYIHLEQCFGGHIVVKRVEGVANTRVEGDSNRCEKGSCQMLRKEGGREQWRRGGRCCKQFWV